MDSDFRESVHHATLYLVLLIFPLGCTSRFVRCIWHRLPGVVC